MEIKEQGGSVWLRVQIVRDESTSNLFVKGEGVFLKWWDCQRR